MWGKVLLRILGCLLAILGIGGIPDAIATWGRWLAMLELWFDSWWVRASVAIGGGCIITYPQWLPIVARRLTGGIEKGSEAQSDKTFAKGLHKLLNEIEGQIEIWENIVTANHPMKHQILNAIGPDVADSHDRFVYTLEKIADTLNMQDQKKFKKIEVAFRQYTHPWMTEKECLDVPFFQETKELERYGRYGMMKIALQRSPSVKCSPRVLKQRLVELRSKIYDEFKWLVNEQA